MKLRYLGAACDGSNARRDGVRRTGATLDHCRGSDEPAPTARLRADSTPAPTDAAPTARRSRPTPEPTDGRRGSARAGATWAYASFLPASRFTSSSGAFSAARLIARHRLTARRRAGNRRPSPRLLGHTIELTSEDGQCSPEGGNTAATRIAADTTIVGLVGSSCSDETVGGIEAITNAGLTTISPSNTRPALTAPIATDTYDGYLRTAHNDEFQGAKAAEFVYDVLGLTKAATIHDGSSYAQALQRRLRRRVHRTGRHDHDPGALSAAEERTWVRFSKTVAATAPEVHLLPRIQRPVRLHHRSGPGHPGPRGRWH